MERRAEILLELIREKITPRGDGNSFTVKSFIKI